MRTHGDAVTIGLLHFATIYPWCCPRHGPLVPRIGEHGDRGRYASLDRGILYRFRKGPEVIVQPERDVVWMDVPCEGHTVRVHYNCTQYFPIVPVSPVRSLADAFWTGDERYPVVEALLRSLYEHQR